LQLQAPPFQEERLLRAAHMFQQVTDHHMHRPNL
jgi:Asp-tRNA(Asn)/Glu-tRNA(Gln) amidotransferase A subunit family amidase